MAKIFESAFSRHRLALGGNKAIKFSKNAEGFGEINAATEAARLGMKEQEIVAHIESHAGYSEKATAGAELWPKEVRVNAASADAMLKAMDAAKQSDADLRKRIASLGGKAPVTATRKELVAILTDLLVGGAPEPKKE